MCKYCEMDILSNEAKRNIRKNQRVTMKIVRNMLNENLYYLEIDTNSYQKEEIDIKYCPFCRKEVGRVKSLKILLVLYIIITLMTLLIATNSNIIIEQRVWILTATYFIGMIAGLLAGYIGLSELIDKEETSNDKRTRENGRINKKY